MENWPRNVKALFLFVKRKKLSLCHCNHILLLFSMCLCALLLWAILFSVFKVNKLTLLLLYFKLANSNICLLVFTCWVYLLFYLSWYQMLVFSIHKVYFLDCTAKLLLGSVKIIEHIIDFRVFFWKANKRTRNIQQTMISTWREQFNFK